MLVMLRYEASDRRFAGGQQARCTIDPSLSLRMTIKVKNDFVMLRYEASDRQQAMCTIDLSFFRMRK